MQNQELINLIIKLIVTAVGLLFTSVIIPWIKANIDAKNLEKIQTLTELAVRYAEQTYKVSEFKDKKDYVYKYILDKAGQMGLKLDEKDINIIVEGIVNAVKYGDME